MSLTRRVRASLRVALTVGLLAPAAALSVGPAVAATASCASTGISVTALGGPNFYIDSGSSPQFRSGYTGYRITNETGAPLDDVWTGLSDFTGGSLALASGQAASQRVGDLGAGEATSRFWYLTATAPNAAAQNHTVTVYDHNPALPDATPLCSTSGGFSSVQGTLAASANKVTGISVDGGTPKLGSTFTVTVTGNTGTIGSGMTGDAESLWMTPAVTENWPADAFRLVGTSLTISPDGTAPQQTDTDTLRVAGLGSAARPYTAAYTFQAIGFSSSPTTVQPVQEIASGTQVKHTGSYSVALPAIAPPVNDLSISSVSTPDRLNLGGGRVRLTGTVSGTAGAELDGFVLGLPTGAQVVSGSARWGDTPIPDPVASGGKEVFTGPFVVGDKTLSVDVDLDSTPGPRALTLAGTVGTASVGSAPSPTDGSNPAVATVQVDTAPVATDHDISTTPGTPVAVNLGALVTDDDHDSWTITNISAPVHGEVSQSQKTITYIPGAGFQGSDSFSYTVDDGRGGTAKGIINVTVDPEATPPAPPAAESIDFAQPDDLTTGDTASLVATADSGLPVSFSTGTPEVCTVDGDSVTAVAAGECEVTAHQDGDDAYSAAEPVTRTFAVTDAVTPPSPSTPSSPPTPLSQEIQFDPPATLLGTDASYDLVASATSGLPVSFVVTSGPCTVAEGSLTATSAGTCTVQARQQGDDTYSGATPVLATISFSTPIDDTADTAGATAVTVDVLANDPENVTLDGVGEPTHGTTTLVDGKVQYRPASSFRGTDRFTYTVVDRDRSATATVKVRVANQRPVVHGRCLAQVAGTTRTLAVRASDPNGDPVVITAASADPLVAVRVDDGKLAVHALPAASGDIVLTVTAHDGAGGTATALLHDRVTPPAPASAQRRLSVTGTRIRWTSAPTGDARYDVLVNGRVACRTRATTCHLTRITGPRRHVTVRTIGRSGTRSPERSVPLAGHGHVLVATVYFTPDSSRLTAHDRGILHTAIRKVHGYGFARANLDGYTDADGGLAYNKALSHRRTRAVAGYLIRHGGIRNVQSWHGETHPVAGNTTAAGKARNRRVEIVVRY